jgi:acetyl-CoA carboxylase carboxyl transferase subunit alpha
MIFMEFEKPTSSHLYDQLDKIKKIAEDGSFRYVQSNSWSLNLKDLKIKQKESTKTLTGWQRVQLSRHPDRPYTQYYISADLFKIY